MRQSWTDERLDDFRGEVGRRFDSVDRRFERLEINIDGLRAESQVEFKAVRTEMKESFDSLHRLMVQFSCMTIVALIGGLIATRL